MFDFRKEMLREADMPTVEEFLENVEKEFRKSFPNGYFNGRESNNMGKSLSVSFGLISKLDDVSNKIRENDPMLSRLIMFPLDKKDFGNGIEVYDTRGSLMVKPEEGSYMAMRGIKFGLKKQKKTDLLKLQDMFKKIFPKIKTTVLDNWDDIYRVSKIPLKYKP